MTLKKLLHAMLLLACCSLTTAQVHLQPTTVKARVLQKDSDGSCFFDSARELLHSEVDGVLNSSIIPQLYGLYRHFPANSCADIHQEHPSGYYWLSGSYGPQQVYCSLNEHHCCNESDGKWMRIAFLNMSDPSAQCPDAWREVESPIRTCRRKYNTSISSVTYSSHGVPYSRVCGRITAYQFGNPEAFCGFLVQDQRSIEDAYVDGISITHGQNPRKHIWTFAAGRDLGLCNCPYCSSDRTITVPPFISGDYFCERETSSDSSLGFIDSNPLWDGHGCTNFSTCCEFNNPPWFCKQLPEPTTEDIEIRIIGYVWLDNSLESEDTPIRFMEILAQ